MDPIHLYHFFCFFISSSFLFPLHKTLTYPLIHMKLHTHVLGWTQENESVEVEDRQADGTEIYVWFYCSHILNSESELKSQEHFFYLISLTLIFFFFFMKDFLCAMTLPRGDPHLLKAPSDLLAESYPSFLLTTICFVLPRLQKPTWSYILWILLYPLSFCVSMASHSKDHHFPLEMLLT